MAAPDSAPARVRFYADFKSGKTAARNGALPALFAFSKSSRVKAEISLLVKKKDYPVGLLKQLNALSGIQLESID